MVPSRQTLTAWSDRLAFDVALCLQDSGDMDEIMDRHEIDADDMLRFQQDKQFLRKVRAYRDEIGEKGISFRLKAKAQAEELLETTYMLIHNREVSPAVKADLIKSVVKWAGLEPKNTGEDNVGGAGVKITINLGSDPQDARIIDATPRVIGYHYTEDD